MARECARTGEPHGAVCDSFGRTALNAPLSEIRSGPESADSDGTLESLERQYIIRVLPKRVERLPVRMALR